MKLDQRYDCAYIFGAVCPARDTGVAIIMPDANIPAMTRHLEAISRHVAKKAHAVIVIDGAGWHRQGDKLIVPANITLLRLPPYSPELNAHGECVGRCGGVQPVNTCASALLDRTMIKPSCEINKRKKNWIQMKNSP